MTGTTENTPTGKDAIEYSIYAYHFPKNEETKNNTWEKLDVTSNLEVAKKKAEALLKSRDYQKVEIKQKYFEPRSSRQIDTTFKIYEHNKKKPAGFFTILVLTLICALITLGILSYLIVPGS